MTYNTSYDCVICIVCTISIPFNGLAEDESESEEGRSTNKLLDVGTMGFSVIVDQSEK
jgi:hypothetical protein